MALIKCEVKQNNKNLGRTKLALEADNPFKYCELGSSFFCKKGGAGQSNDKAGADSVLDSLVELASEENKAKAILIKEQFLSDFEKSYWYERVAGMLIILKMKKKSLIICTGYKIL